VRFEVFTSAWASTNTAVFCAVVPFSLTEVCRCLKGACCLHRQVFHSCVKRLTCILNLHLLSFHSSPVAIEVSITANWTLQQHSVHSGTKLQPPKTAKDDVRTCFIWFPLPLQTNAAMSHTNNRNVTLRSQSAVLYPNHSYYVGSKTAKRYLYTVWQVTVTKCGSI
jgi:hypothetical protein